jgi:hypothetical protein
MTITDYVISLQGEPLSNRLRIRKALTRHGQRYAFDIPAIESPMDTSGLYLIFFDSQPYPGWVTSSSHADRIVLSVDQFVSKFTRINHTRRSR